MVEVGRGDRGGWGSRGRWVGVAGGSSEVDRTQSTD